MNRLYLLPLLAILAGCGAESLETAAVAAKAKQEEIKQGQQLQEDVQNKLDAAMQQGQQRLDDAAAKE